MNVDKMRRYSATAAAVEADRERADWLAAMTPEHRAQHEGDRRPFICSECSQRSLEPLRRMRAQRGASEKVER